MNLKVSFLWKTNSTWLESIHNKDLLQHSYHKLQTIFKECDNCSVEVKKNTDQAEVGAIQDTRNEWWHNQMHS